MDALIQKRIPGLENPAALLAAIVESSDDAIVSSTLGGIITSWNGGAERIFGFTAAEAIGRPISIIMPPDRYGEAQLIGSKLRRGERVDHFETVRCRKDGRRLDVSLTISPIRDRHGKIVGASKTARDISQRRHDEAHLRHVMRELDHRVKNNLALIEAIIERTAQTATDTAGFARALAGRVHALSRLHEVLALHHWEGAELGEVVRQVMSSLPPDQRERISCEGDSVQISGRIASILCLALHELTTNAARFGALSVPEGRVLVEWQERRRPDGASGLLLRWAEHNGPPVHPPTHRGFGRELIESGLPYETRGSSTLEFRPEGVRCTIEAPTGT